MSIHKTAPYFFSLHMRLPTYPHMADYVHLLVKDLLALTLQPLLNADLSFTPALSSLF
jgi:hypothetical protein